MKYPLLPPPKAIALFAGAYRFGADACIAMPVGADEQSFLAARQLQVEIHRATGRELPIIRSGTPPQGAILLVCGPQQAAAFGIEPDWPQAPSADQAYRLTINPAGITLVAVAPRGLFYAVQTLRQLVRLHGQEVLVTGLPAMTIHDWPALPYRGLMLDVSRGKVPTLATLRDLVAELSHYKINVLQLYTEHTFQFPRHPRSALTAIPSAAGISWNWTPSAAPTTSNSCPICNPSATRTTRSTFLNISIWLSQTGFGR